MPSTLEQRLIDVVDRAAQQQINTEYYVVTHHARHPPEVAEQIRADNPVNHIPCLGVQELPDP